MFGFVFIFRVFVVWEFLVNKIFWLIFLFIFRFFFLLVLFVMVILFLNLLLIWVNWGNIVFDIKGWVVIKVVFLLLKCKFLFVVIVIIC